MGPEATLSQGSLWITWKTRALSKSVITSHLLKEWHALSDKQCFASFCITISQLVQIFNRKNLTSHLKRKKYLANQLEGLPIFLLVHWICFHLKMHVFFFVSSSHDYLCGWGEEKISPGLYQTISPFIGDREILTDMEEQVRKQLPPVSSPQHQLVGIWPLKSIRNERDSLPVSLNHFYYLFIS